MVVRDLQPRTFITGMIVRSSSGSAEGEVYRDRSVREIFMLELHHCASMETDFMNIY
jgi:hypothetical protein